MNKTKLLDKAKTLPKLPGCYLMKNRREEVIYVGKAKSLKNRVMSYFQSGQKTPKTEILVSHIVDFEFQLTENEVEALVLENNLIKKHSPRYNISMRDDKSYPYVYVNLEEKFPRLLYDRRPNRKKKAKIYGPFAIGSNISEVIRVLTKSFELRDCTLKEFKSRKEPCLLYQMKQCSAPCVELINEVEYEKSLQLALNFFENKQKKSLAILNERMQTASDEEKFELAAVYRDNIEILEGFINFGSQKNAELTNIKEQSVDIISTFVGDIEVDLSIYMIRNGVLLGHKNFHFPLIDCMDEVEDETINYLMQYYTQTSDELPEHIVFDLEDEKRGEFQKALNLILKQFEDRPSKNIKIIRPGRKFASLLNLSNENAKEQQRVRLTNQESVYVGLNKLKELLSLKDRPKKLECYDIAIWQGKSPTASQVVSVDGKLSKSDYRYYHIATRPEGNNDFEMMKEVLERRVKHGLLPDVIIVDGGKGQVSSALAALKEADLDVPVCGIAKSKTKSNFKDDEVQKTEERLIIPGRSNPYILTKNKSLMRIIVQLRDEAHRFSRKLHHNVEKGRIFSSWLDEIPGLGPKTKEKLLKTMTMSKEEMSELSFEELRRELPIRTSLVEKVFKFLKSNS